MTLRSRIDPSIEISSLQKNTDSSCGPYEYLRECTLPGPYSEVISDETPRFERYGNCSHVKILRNYASGSYAGSNEATHPGHTFSTSDRRIWGAQINAWNPPIDETLDLNILNARAYSAMKPTLDCGFSVSNFLIELAEFKWIISAYRKAKKSYDFVNRIRKTRLHKSFDAVESVFGVDTTKKGATANMSSAYLMYQFGWKLFVKDLMELYSLLSNYEKTLHDYTSRQHIPQVRHYEEKLYSGATGTVISTPFRRTYKYDSIFHATMKYTYRIEGLDSEYAKFKGILDIIGLKMNAAVVWDAIPFSFVIDWFYDVGSSLKSRWSSDYLNSVVTILDYCYSVKSNLKEEAWLSDPQDPECYLGSIETASYNRRRALPRTDGFGISEQGRYGTKQVLLSAALLLA